MGFYPVCPGTDQYVLGAPYLPYMKVSLENGKTFEVRADKVSDKNRYVKSVRLNGKPYTKAYITQQDIMNGGELTFEMTSSPVSYTHLDVYKRQSMGWYGSTRKTTGRKAIVPTCISLS